MALAAPTRDLPVDLYIGGVEHAIMHLLYARFVAKFLEREVGVQGMEKGEPFVKLLAQGMVRGKTYRDPNTGRYLRPAELTDANEPKIAATGELPAVSWEKMSKSKYNGVDPETVVRDHGSDATRLFVMYKAAPADELLWDDGAIVGMERWIERVWNLAVGVGRSDESSSKATSFDGDQELESALHLCIDQVTEALSKTHALHVAIASLIKLTRAIEAHPSRSHISRTATVTLVKMLAPFAPCVSQEIWERIGTGGPLFEERWPEADGTVLSRGKVVCAIMVNGKTRGTMTVPLAALADVELLETLARKSDAGKRWLVDQKTGKAIPASRVLIGKAAKKGKGRVVSFVVK
ncbi:hypothetical protein HKX48_008614 [Thoreauomyces humboldtii]|nr:hypothetical protein HKX48_008614 [Thoreauomyces humboldtii]